MDPEEDSVGGNTANGPESVADAAVKAHLRSILDSHHFANAHQLQAFLEFLVTAILEGRQEELKEYNLGRDVFRRGEHYDPRTDAIVRVQASVLRKRLAAYYQKEGREDRLRFELPKGTYVLAISERAVQDPAGKPDVDSQDEPKEAPSRRGFLAMAGAFAGGAAAAGGAMLLARIGFDSSAFETPSTPNVFDVRKVSPRLWGTLLDGSHSIQLAFGCPQFFQGGGMYVRDIHVNNSASEIADSRLQELTRKLGVYLVPAPHTYTGVGEILGIHRVTQFITYRGIEADLENVQLLTPEDIRNKDFILVSSYRFQTVLDLLNLPREFKDNFTGSGGIELKNPSTGEQKLYQTAGSGGISRSYGVVSFWREPATGGRILSLSGIDSPSTLGTVLYATNQERLEELEERLADDDTQDAVGFQVLVEIHTREDRPFSTQYSTHRILRPGK